MKFFAAGVKVLSGESKKSGADFEMSMIFGLAPVENFQKGKLQAVGYGYEPMEIQLDPDAIDQFKSVKFPAELDLETDAVPRFGKYETVVIGIKGAKPVAVKAA
jgi:hypothetical protein